MCTYLTKRSSTYYFRRAVPDDLAGRFINAHGRPVKEWTYSLGVKDRAEAKRLIPARTMETDRLIEDARANPLRRAVSHDPAAKAQEQKREQAQWEYEQAGAAQSEQESEAQAGRQAARASLRRRLEQRLELTTAELSPEEAAFKDLLNDKDFDLVSANETLRHYKRTLGQVAKTRDISRLNAPFISQPVAKSKPLVSITEMFNAYGRQDGLRTATVHQFGAVIAHFVKFLSHDDATVVTTQDIIRWRLHLVTEISSRGKPRAPSTINGSYLAAVSVTFAYGFNVRQIDANPFTGVASTRAAKSIRLREKDFTLAERATILSATLAPMSERLPAEQALARRWVPWLCAYTGARVNEMTQLRGEDVTQIDGIWSIKVTPEAGNVKTDAARYVPLHEHLIQQGFPAVAIANGPGPLFYRTDKGRGGKTDRATYAKTGMKLAEWVRAVGITDRSVQPNHAWRHTFKTICFEVGIEERAADYMQGHASRGVGRSYGSNSLPALAKQLEKFPRFPVEAGAADG